jgi:uncharacterized protein (TIGR01244 family)
MSTHWMIPVLALTGMVAMAAAPVRAAETFGIPNATFPEPGLMAAGQPTGEQIQIRAEEGYRTVIDLRSAEEPRGFDEVEAATQNGLEYLQVPVTPDGLDQATIDRFLAAMRKAQRPALVHCSTSNRVGALYYSWLVLEKGMPPADALARAKAAGLRSPELTGKVRKLVAERKAPAQ